MRTGVVVAVLAGMASWLLLQVVRSLGGAYPVISWLGLVPLVAVTLLVLVMCRQIRRYLQGRGTLRPSPQRGRGTLVGAQAAALGGAALLGWYAANALVHLPNADVPSERVQLVWGVVHAVAALALAAAGFVGQAWCRIPPTEHDDDDDDGVADGDLAYG
ncbi:secreted protein [Serinicoccus hydrothermalis]|uniref:Secreted protein n=1 Tax=Serinicoccus hydrothermalis TaxID=1758689 RepID=A0A1B1NBN7_9MICO|nr:secreted protein [Serinicoccus hydrothermalis]